MIYPGVVGVSDISSLELRPGIVASAIKTSDNQEQHSANLRKTSTKHYLPVEKIIYTQKQLLMI